MKKILADKCVDIIVSVGPNFFYTVTLACSLWFFDKGKRTGTRQNKVLFIDARNIYRRIDRSHRDWSSSQVEFLSNIARLYRGDPIENLHDSSVQMNQYFPSGKYIDVPGLCRIVELEDLEGQGWSLNPGRYVGVANQASEEIDYRATLSDLFDEFQELNTESRDLEASIADSIDKLLGDAKC